MSDSDLEAALYANHGTKRGYRRHAEPDWLTVHRELKRKHVTLVIVWDEYIATNPGGYSYSRFCELYRGFESKLSPTMQQTHAAGERLFVDYAGDGGPVVIGRYPARAIADRAANFGSNFPSIKDGRIPSEGFCELVRAAEKVGYRRRVPARTSRGPNATVI